MRFDRFVSPSFVNKKSQISRNCRIKPPPVKAELKKSDGYKKSIDKSDDV